MAKMALWLAFEKWFTTNSNNQKENVKRVNQMNTILKV